MEPSHPIAIPQQQVIQVAMISSPIQQEKVEPVSETLQAIPPKAVGMKKVQSEPKKEEVRKSPEPEQSKRLAALVSTSGPQANDAKAINAAITQPLFGAAYLRNPPPAYPPAARRQKVEGKVVLDVDVSNNGEAIRVSIVRSSGYSLLDDAAREAVTHWRFIPARRGSESVAANVIVPIIFKIGEI